MCDHPCFGMGTDHVSFLYSRCAKRAKVQEEEEFENLGEVGEYVPEFASKLNFEDTIWILSKLCNIKSRRFCEIDNS